MLVSTAVNLASTNFVDHLADFRPLGRPGGTLTAKTEGSELERLRRWRFDILIAATALVAGLPLVHHNPEDFESLRRVVERWPDRFPGVGPLNLILSSCR